MIFNKYTKKIDSRAFRAEHAREGYEELLQQKREQGEEILKNYRGYDMECLRQVSHDLGHKSSECGCWTLYEVKVECSL